MSPQLYSTEGMIALSYLTNYDIKQIFEILKFYQNKTLLEFFEEVKDRPSTIKVANQLSWTDYIPKYNEIIASTVRCLEQLDYYQIHAIPINSVQYPEKLRKLTNPPPVLYVKGQLRHDINCVAVVGTREMSQFGAHKTSRVVELLANAGYGIVSGLAAGIDTAAHLTALNMNTYTLAVMAHSLNTIYPPENYGLAKKILDSGGALVSELPIGINRGKRDFVERNRLQVAFSDAVVPIELLPTSGTMHTVNQAKAQNKHLFLIRPTSAEAATSQYSGVIELMRLNQISPMPYVQFVKDSTDFNLKLTEMAKTIKETNQRELFE